MKTIPRNELIEEMTDAALNNYEFSCEWPKAAVAAMEVMQDYGLKVEKPLAFYAVNLAKLKWQGLIIKAQNTNGCQSKCVLRGKLP